MTDFSPLSTENLKKMDKQALISIVLSQQEQLKAISKQLDFVTEQILLMNQRSFGRKTEQADQLEQFSMYDYFNEPEAKSDDSPEPDITEVTISSYTRKKKTKREEKLEGLPARIFEHELSAEELAEKFPEGYKELPSEVYKRLHVIPETFIVDEHHVHVYASKKNTGVIRKASRPADLFRNSIATPALVASIMNAKYANAMPLDRQSRVFKTNGINLSTNTMANWVIKATESYLSILYDRLHERIYGKRQIMTR